MASSLLVHIVACSAAQRGASEAEPRIPLVSMDTASEKGWLGETLVVEFPRGWTGRRARTTFTREAEAKGAVAVGDLEFHLAVEHQRRHYDCVLRVVAVPYGQQEPWPEKNQDTRELEAFETSSSTVQEAPRCNSRGECTSGFRERKSYGKRIWQAAARFDPVFYSGRPPRGEHEYVAVVAVVCLRVEKPLRSHFVRGVMYTAPAAPSEVPPADTPPPGGDPVEAVTVDAGP